MIKKTFLAVWLCLSFISLEARKKVVYFEPGPVGDMFNLNHPSHNRDNILLPFYELKVALEKLGYDVRTTSRLDNLHDADHIVCFSVLTRLQDLRKYPKSKCILFLWEPPTVTPENYYPGNHEYFGKVYTWQDDLVDNEKYFKFFDPTPAYPMVDVVPFGQKKNFVMLTQGIHRSHPLSLTSERWKIVDFFEKNYEGDFDLWGRRWPKGYSKNYKGTTPTKIECFKNYKFSFCYENMRDVQGYITAQKIFNSFAASCVPIFWGASNVEKYIPKSCFIDKRDFPTYEELCFFLKNMPQEKYEEYLQNIRSYLASSQALLFSPVFFIDTVIRSFDPGYSRWTAFTEQQLAELERVEQYLKEHPLF